MGSGIPRNFSIYALAFHFILKNFVYLLTFVCAGSLSLRGLFSSCGEQGLLSSCDVQDSHCSGFSCCRAWAVGRPGFSSCGSWALEHRLNSCGTWAQLPRSMWDLLGSGKEPLSPALASGFFTTEPPGKSYSLFFLRRNSHKINLFKVYNLVAFSTFTMLYNHHSIWFQSIFITLKGKFTPIKQSFPLLLSPQPLATTHLLSVSTDLPFLNFQYK